MTIRFGTDGWRGLLAEDFTFGNLEKVARALGLYLQDLNGERGVVIGYDTRFLAREMAGRVAGVLNNMNIPVYMADSPHPTPVVARGILDMGLAGGIMITDSHNPPQYSGIKFIPEDGAPALPEVTEAIEKKLEKVDQDKIEVMEMEKARSRGLFQDWNGKDKYFQRLKKAARWDILAKNPQRVIVNPLFGAGQGYIEEILDDCGWQVSSRDTGYDPYFGGSMPDPSQRRLQNLSKEVNETGAVLGLALDGDGDRFGVIDRDGTFLSPNQFLFLLAYYLFEGRGEKGHLGRTVATTHLLDRIARSQGQKLIETPVGFKYMGELLKQGLVIMAGEESGGVSLKKHMPEKDGILACILACEMVSFFGQSLEELLDKAYKEYGYLVSRRFDIPYAAEDRENIMRGIKELNPEKLDGEEISERKTIDGTKLVLKGGDWVLLRPSGTEPLVRLYVEAASEERMFNLAGELRNILGL